jgi:YD repeat-containing protein
MNGIYGADMLSVKKMTDEDGHITYEFRDKQDRLILQRCMLSTDNSADTYYAYDYRGNLCYVLQPEYQNNADLNLFAFQYKYDSRHNVIEKKLPGADPIKYAYDKANRLIFSQDGVQRQQYCLTFMLYDIHGRLVLKGSSTSVTLPNVSSTFVYANKGTSGGIGTSGYTTNLSLVSPTVEQAHYYDDYTFKVNALGFGNSAFTNGTVSAKGLETGKRIATLQSTPSNYYSVMHYDIKGRNTKTVSTNQLNGTETVTTTYGYTDLPQTVTHVHTASGLSTQTEVMTYTYDQADRELTVTHKLNNNATVTLKSNSYDKYGRLHTSNLMNSETVTYGYNIRSWLTNISSTNFTDSLLYFGTPNQCFNGNISRIFWKQNSTSTMRGYDFTYDPLNRLTSAVYGESTNLQSNVNRYTTSYTYDKNGNFLTLTRRGLQDGGSYGLIDDLTFTLTGNQVTKIEDAATDPTYYGVFNFKDGASQSNEYTYDKNGNMTKDLNKNISSIQYNSLNLPSKVSFSNGKYMDYVYSATGEKRSVTYNVLSSGGNYTYCDNFIYYNGSLNKILVDGGYISISGTTPTYHYYLKDHLGNNRVVVDASGTVKQVTHYYPFGGFFGESIGSSYQTYKYNGKTVSLKASQYQHGGTLAVVMETEDGESYVITTNLRSPFQSESMAFLDTNNYPKIESFIQKNKLGIPMGVNDASGFCSYPLYTLFIEGL